MSAPGLVIAFALSVPCAGPEATPWLTDFRDRVLAYDGLAAFVVAEMGPPTMCEGDVMTEFDGASYGALRLSFGTDVTLTVETQPIETSIVTLRSEGGFADPMKVDAALRDYATGIGVSIDWEHGQASIEGEEEVTRFRDPDPGLNASAELRRSEGRLLAIRFSMAL